jgi:DNA polymerase III subunit epsilon
MGSRFVAIDFETANASLASICQIGVAVFIDGQIVDEWETLINPED